jgi:hypothetical protein
MQREDELRPGTVDVNDLAVVHRIMQMVEGISDVSVGSRFSLSTDFLLPHDALHGVLVCDPDLHQPPPVILRGK